jgi:hypothetical protein
MLRQIILPTGKSKPTRRDPRVTILYSAPKMGKTTLVSTLPNSMILDLEGGTQFLNSLSMHIIGITPPENETQESFDARMALEVPKYYLVEAGRAIMEAKRPFDFIVLDTVTKLEDMSLGLAAEKYRNTPMGKGFDGDDVRILPKGSGYLYLRLAFMELVEKCKKLADNIILVGHLKDSVIEKAGKEVDAKDLDLTGKLKQILCADADAIGYLHRGKSGEMLINFKSSDQILCGSRCDHLRGQVIKIADYDEEKNELINIDWGTIFPDKFKPNNGK